MSDTFDAYAKQLIQPAFDALAHIVADKLRCDGRRFDNDIATAIKWRDALREIIRIRDEECSGTDGTKQANVARRALADG